MHRRGIRNTEGGRVSALLLNMNKKHTKKGKRTRKLSTILSLDLSNVSSRQRSSLDPRGPTTFLVRVEARNEPAKSRRIGQRRQKGGKRRHQQTQSWRECNRNEETTCGSKSFLLCTRGSKAIATSQTGGRCGGVAAAAACGGRGARETHTSPR